MRIRQLVFVLAVVATSAASAQETKGVVTLPGVHASATPGCVDHDDTSSATLSYACLNHLVATDVTPVPMPGDADITKRPSNTIGLYNANSLSHRMGPNLGISVQPYRPKVAYPTPLATPPAR
jgi:ABC-type Fe3+-citrate transport system substrate-binding protein